MENKNIFKKCMILLLGVIATLPLISAYPASMPAYDLYAVFVEAVFGGFWLSVMGLAIIMYILLGFIGGLSQFTAMQYCVIFILAMSLGYTSMLFLIPIFTALVGWSVYQIFRYINSASAA
jgi:hypothetical protein